MSEKTQTIFEVAQEWEDRAHINNKQYLERCQTASLEPDEYWRKEAQALDWYKFPSKIRNCSFDPKDFKIKWFEDGELNVSVNCIDRHLKTKGDKVALIWESDDPNVDAKVTYNQLYEKVCRMSNALKSLGVAKGDRVVIYMPMVVEATYAMLACSRIGAVHTVVFGGFSPQALAGRINDAKAKVVITADAGVRGGREVALKDNTDAAIKMCSTVEKVLVVKRTGKKIHWEEGRDVWYHEIIKDVAATCEPERMNAEDPLFILYTSGSTGTPKGVLHTTGGYLLWATLTFKYVFDYHDEDVYWCSADVGWVTGHTYIVYGPLSNAATSLVFEGVPNYPDTSRFWQVIDKHQVNIFYTAPTAIRALMREGDEPVKKTSRKSLRLLGSVGEPINPEAWLWYHEVVGEKRCPVVDTWWQTETGGILISPLPGANGQKPGSATRPLPGVYPQLLDNDGKKIDGAGEGNLVIQQSWPGQMRTVYGDHKRFIETYFSMFPGYYVTGDGARRDEDGYFWITGRIDDVLNVSGHRLGTAEIESALVDHDMVAEAAVVGFPHDIKGTGIYCYLTLLKGVEPSDDLKKQCQQHVRKILGPIATPDVVQWAPALPKTRSGKIMRRILRKVAAFEEDSLGDISTLADPSVVETIIAERKKLA